jgi:signal transduction histidine kinase
LHPQPDRYRFFGRLRAPADPGETRRIERWLATARLFLAISALAAIYMDPTQLGHAPIAYGLLGFYLVHGVLVMTLLRRREQSTPSFRLLVHTADIIWPAFISIFAEGPPGGPFFLFFFFVLAAAAYRWGVWETLGTAAAEVVLLWMESVVVRYVWLAPGGALPWHVLAGLRVNVAEFEPKRLFMLSVYLLVMGLLLGYLAEQQKQLRTEKSVVALILGKARVETGLTGTLQEIFREIITLYGAARLLIAAQEVHSHRVFLGEVRCSRNVRSELRWLDFAARDAEVYLYHCPGEVSYGSREGSGWSVLALDDGGNRVQASTGQSLERLAELDPFHSVAAVSFLFGGEWRGRVFIFDPSRLGKRQEELRFLQDLVRHVGPAVYNVYLLHRLRRRAEAAERARVARELHDGAVQSLIAVEMQVDVLRRQATAVPGPVSAELGRIQGLLREEVLKLRELMQQMKSIDVDARKFIGVLHDTVERFGRETGISTRFVTDVDELDMPQRVCRELVRIVQEGLVNVRKHSSARHALVRFGASGDQWVLTLEDDGKGFPFSGRLTEAEMEQIGKGPLIIKERTHLIAGKLTVESNSGQGARVEVTVPRTGEVAHEF